MQQILCAKYIWQCFVFRSARIGVSNIKVLSVIINNHQAYQLDNIDKSHDRHKCSTKLGSMAIRLIDWLIGTKNSLGTH